MMRSKKTRIAGAAALLAASSLLFAGLTACGASENEETVTSSETETVTEEETTSESTESDTEEESTASETDPETTEEEAEAAVFPYTFSDDAGNEITMQARPEKVAVLFSSYAEIWTDCGGDISVTVGDAVTRGFASEDCVLVNDGAGLKFDMEALVASEPDFVIMTADFKSQSEGAAELNAMGIPAAAFHEENFDDYLRILKIFADLNENGTACEEKGLEVQAEIDEILASVPEDREAKSYLFIRAGSAFDSTKARTAENHFACVMMDELGGVNIADGDEMLTEELSLETILERDPEMILIVPQGDEDAAKSYIESLFASDGWKDVGAVKEGNVHYLPKELFNYKPNSRWPEAYRMLNELWD